MYTFEQKIVLNTEETALRAITAAKEHFGALHILLNNAGVGNYKPLIDTSAEVYDELMDTNGNCPGGIAEAARKQL